MLLKDLLGKGEVRLSGPETVDIASLSTDSRKVVPGALFAALPGVNQDGLNFVSEALAKGAVAILAGKPRPQDFPETLAWIEAKEPRLALAHVAARFYRDQPRVIVAVTGTSGKTSVVNFAAQIFDFCGFDSASLGTLGVVSRKSQAYGALTTPDPIALHKLLAQLHQNGVTHVALEASSHGLDQFRLDGVRFKAGAFTNLTRDHLDYHASMESYLAAKLRLVSGLLPQGAPFVVSADAPYAEAFIAAAKKHKLRLMTVGEGETDISILARGRLANGQHLSLGGPWGRAEVRLPLIGDFQAMNALTAAGLALAVDCPPAKVFAALERLKGVKGRMEKVAEHNGAGIYVDYAHKPDALAKLLDAMRPYTRGRLIVVLGAGGDRDPGKRPVMGAIAAEKADIVIVTDDNPRSENPATIRRAILEAAPDAIEIGDRAAAIAAGITKAKAGDIVVIAGKGHETGQIVGSHTRPFSDHEAIREAIAQVKH